MSDTQKTDTPEEDRRSALQANKDRTDETAAAEATMFTHALKQEGIDPETRARLMAQKLSAEGQLRSAEERARFERMCQQHKENER